MRPNRSVLPPAADLRVMVEQEGLTHRQIAERFGVRREAVTMKLSRGDVSVQVRHTELLPWRVKLDHSMEYAARMLRVEGRLRLSLPVPEREERRVATWRERLHRDNTVIMYLPEHNAPRCTCEGRGGFHYVPRQAAEAKYGTPHPDFDSELIFVTQRQGEAIRGSAA